MEPTTTPAEDRLPADIQNWLNTFAPNVREWLQAQLVALSQIARRLDAFRTRLDAVEGNVEHILQAGPGTNGASPAQTIEPIPLATIVERLDRLEQMVATLRPTESSPIPPTPKRGSPAQVSQSRAPTTRARSASQSISTAAADEIRLELLNAHQNGSVDFGATQRRMMETHGITDRQLAAIWARCQGKFRPDFVGRVLRDTPKIHRVNVRDVLAVVYAVSPDEILAWYTARNGNGGSPPPQPRPARRRIVRPPDTKKK